MRDPQAYADVLVLAMKSALAPVLVRLDALEARVQDDTVTKDVGSLRERVVLIEVRPVVPGPPGDPGPPGKDGVDGKPGLTYCGVFVEGKSYDVGELVTWGGSMWHCNEPTESKPGEGTKAWVLAVKRGRDGKDGKP